MNGRDRQSQLIDYLYDELPPAEREAFERAMQKDDALRSEVESLRSTRLLVRKAEPEEAPAAIFQDLMREARQAAASHRDPSWWEKLAALLVQPAFATAALVVVLTVTGIYFASNDAGQPDAAVPRISSDPMTVATAEEYDEAEAAAPEAPAAAPEEAAAAEPAVATEEPWAEGEAPPKVEPPGRFAETASAEPPAEPESEVAVLPIPSPADERADEDAVADAPAAKAPARRYRARKARQRRVAEQPAQDSSVFDGLAVGSVGGAGRAADGKPAAPPSGRSATGGEARDAENQVAADRRKLNVGAPAPEAKGAEVAEVAQRAQLDDAPVAEAEDKGDPRRRVTTVYRGYRDSKDTDDLKKSKEAEPSRVVYGQKAEPAPAQAPAAKPTAAGEKKEEVAQQQVARREQGEAEESAEPPPREADKVVERRAQRYDRAMTHYRERRYKQAIQDFESYLGEGGPNAADARLNLARAYEQTNELRDAIARYRELLSRHPGYAYRAAVLIDIARLEARVGNLEEARKLLTEAAKDKSVAARAKERLAAIEARIEAREQARRKAVRKKADEAAEEPAAEPTKAPPAK